MSVRAKLAAFALVLAAAFGAGAGLGAAVGPIDTGEQEPSPAHEPEAPTHGFGSDGH